MIAALLLTVVVTSQQPEPHLRFRESIPVLTAGAALDFTTTEWALRRHGVTETNPLARGGLPERAFLQVGFVAVELAVVHTVDRKAGRKWGRRTLYGIAVAKVVIAGWNIHQGRKAGRAAR